MRPTTVQHLRFLEHSLTAARDRLLERAHRVPALCVRDAGYDVVVLHYSVMCARWEPSVTFWRWRPTWLASLDAVRGGDAAGRVRLRRRPRRVAGRHRRGRAVLGAGARALAAAVPQGRAVARMEKTLTGFVDDSGRRRARAAAPRGAASSTSPTGPGSCPTTSAPRPAEAPHRRARSSRAPTPPACGPTSRPASRPRSTATTGIELPGLRPLRDRLRERLQRLDLRGEMRRVEAVLAGRAPRGHLRGVHGHAAAGLGRPRLHGHQPAHLRGRARRRRARCSWRAPTTA